MKCVILQSMTKVPPHLHNKLLTSHDKTGLDGEASWLNWWKKNISSDDYLKYLSTQVIFSTECSFNEF